MTLGGLALAVGILVDEATVSIENIHVHLTRGKSARPRRAATPPPKPPGRGCWRCFAFWRCSCPRCSWSGAAKAMFLPLSLAVGFSMVASYLLSSTLVPILSVWVLRGHEQSVGGPKRGESGFARFQRTLCRLLASRVVRLALAGGGRLSRGHRRLSSSFIGRAVGHGNLPPGRGRPASGAAARAAPARRSTAPKPSRCGRWTSIKQEAGPQNVEITLGFVGVHGSELSHQPDLSLERRARGRRGAGAIEEERARSASSDLKERLREEVRRADARRELLLRAERYRQPGDEPRVADADRGGGQRPEPGGRPRVCAQKSSTRLQQIPALRDVQFGQSLDYPTVDVTVDRQKAGLMGVKMADVSRSLVTATSSSRFIVPNYWADPNSGVAYQIQVQIPQARMDSLEQARNLPVTNRDGQETSAAQRRQVTEGTAVGQYQRYNMQRMITVTANIAGADLGSVARQCRAARPGTWARRRPRVNVAVRGQIVPLQQMLDGLRAGLLLAVVVIFLLLAANFQSLKLAFIVVSTAPAVIAGVVLVLWADRHDAQYSVLHGRDHGHRRGGGQCHPAGDLRRAQPDRRSDSGGRGDRRRPQPAAPDPHDEPGDDCGHDADGARPGRRQPAVRAAGPGGGSAGWRWPRWPPCSCSHPCLQSCRRAPIAVPHHWIRMMRMDAPPP